MIHETYFFKPDHYNPKGELREAPETLFHHFVEQCERDFYARFGPIAPNQLKANTSTMLLLQACFQLGAEAFGIDGELDLETNQRIDENSERVMVYAIGCSIPEKEDDPLYLLIDDGVPDGRLYLLHSPEDGNEGEIAPYFKLNAITPDVYS